MPRSRVVLLALAVLLIAILLQEVPQRMPPQPVPAVLYEGEKELRQHQLYVKRARREKPPVVFLGDSITYSWGDPGRVNVTAEPLYEESGLAVWNEHFAPLGAANFGYPGDDTPSLRWRVEHGDIGQPKAIVLLIGTNDLARSRSPDETADNVVEIVRLLQRKAQGAPILLLGILPRAYETDDASMPGKVRAVNRRLAALRIEGVHFLDAGKAFLKEDGSIKPGVLTDGVHLSGGGYRLLAGEIAPALQEMLARQ